jgi:hypothetical protein
MDIRGYIEELSKDRIVSTAKPDVKNSLVEYLENKGIKYICEMDNNFLYTIQLV